MVFKGWEKAEISTPFGEVEGIAPLIISASRSTDIPAFHSEWFMRRLSAGYVKWINPFNKTPQFVSLNKARVIVFWSKNARPIFEYLPEIEKRNINYYFTFTINDYEKENFEPNVPPLRDRIDTFKVLAEKIGKERVIWRFDPLILTDRLDVTELLDRIYNVGNKLHKHTEKLVISFVDISNYQKVIRNLAGHGQRCREFTHGEIEQLARGLEKMKEEWGIQAATCAEKVDLSKYGITKNKCIDDDLMARVFKHDDVLMNFLGRSSREYDLFSSEKGNPGNLKDRGQRADCGCIMSKDIGQYNTCMHLCTYCYANFSDNIVKRNFLKTQRTDSESIITL